jgi:ABC-type polysaccharide/polyol phosphate export permease
MVAMMSILYGRLFKLPQDVYIPFLASGMIIWALIASLLNEGCTSFMAADSLIKQVRMPLTLHVCRMVWRNVIVFLHNGVILVPVWIIFDRPIGLIEVLAALAALALIAVNGLWVGIVLGALCARFRDVGQIIANLVQVVFFVTPIMWLPSILEGRGIAWWLVEVNPFFHFIETVRAPLLGDPVPYVSWGVVCGVTLAGALLGMAMLGRFRDRIAYWL